MVAPHWGAWIEIKTLVTAFSTSKTSHPTGVRGLKYALLLALRGVGLSHPTGVRGLK